MRQGLRRANESSFSDSNARDQDGLVTQVELEVISEVCDGIETKLWTLTDRNFSCLQNLTTALREIRMVEGVKISNLKIGF